VIAISACLWARKWGAVHLAFGLPLVRKDSEVYLRFAF
jgi:hypothetical protein